jgi:8-oxo-dGTP pyrophosphatase MutT (NUDIX family)
VKVNVAAQRTIAAKNTFGIQYAALPYRLSGDTLEILLITSRRTRRWIIPKGWPMEGHQPSMCAALEALEEAGVSGEIEKNAFGHYQYIKQFRLGINVPCKVDIFALKVTRERKTWAERNQRERRWCTVAEAAAAVSEPELRRLIVRFGVQMAAAGKR